MAVEITPTNPATETSIIDNFSWVSRYSLKRFGLTVDEEDQYDIETNSLLATEFTINLTNQSEKALPTIRVRHHQRISPSPERPSLVEVDINPGFDNLDDNQQALALMFAARIFHQPHVVPQITIDPLLNSETRENVTSFLAEISKNKPTILMRLQLLYRQGIIEKFGPAQLTNEIQ